MNSYLRLFLIGLIAFIYFGRVAASEEYRDRVRRYTLRVPPEWQRFSREKLKVANQLHKTEFDIGFQPALVVDRDTRMLVEYMRCDFNGMSPNQILQFLRSSNPLDVISMDGARLDDQVQVANIRTAVFDEKENRVITRQQIPLIGNRSGFGVSYGMISKEGIIWLRGYAEEKDFDEYLPVFNSMAESFRYDEDHRLVPPRNLFTTALIVSAVGAILVTLITVRFFLKRRRIRRATGSL